ILVNSIVIIAVAGLFPSSFHVANIQTAILASVILLLLNTLVKPILVLITLPVTVITMGFFLFIINAITLSMAASLVGPSFSISGFSTALMISMIMSALNFSLQQVFIRPLEHNDRNREE